MKKYLYAIAALAACVFFASCENYDVEEVNKPKVIEFQERTLNVTPGYALPAEAEAVDLGLSVKWANMNIGQTATAFDDRLAFVYGGQTPSSFGTRFAWGEIAPKNSYEWTDYEFAENVTDPDHVTLNHYVFGDNQKYNDGTKKGDNLHKNDDVAYVMWGEDWRMPTAEEVQELLSLDIKVNYLTKTIRIYGKNGNYIDMPFYNEGFLSFWTSTLTCDPAIVRPQELFASSFTFCVNNFDYQRYMTDDPKTKYRDEFVKEINYLSTSERCRNVGLFIRPVHK